MYWIFVAGIRYYGPFESSQDCWDWLCYHDEVRDWSENVSILDLRRYSGVVVEIRKEQHENEVR